MNEKKSAPSPIDTMPQIRVLGFKFGGKETPKVLSVYRSNFVPRTGDFWCYQYWTCEVYRVEVTLLDGRQMVDVYVDAREIEV